MNKKIKQKWLEALRSGQYKQCKETLTNGEGFCCLGVLCNIHALEHNKVWENEFAPRYFNCFAYLPKQVMKWSEVKSIDGEFIDGYHNCCSLAILNDEGKSFKEIVDIIEKYF